MAKVSIVVPVYNQEKYLEKCLEGIRNQTLKEIEIILINDGSTDKSLEICRRHKCEDDRIRIINQPNGGVSVARNAGIKASTGTYVGLLDPDDWIEPDMYESMCRSLEACDADACLCNYVLEEENSSEIVMLGNTKDCLEKEDMISQVLQEMIAAPSADSGSSSVMGTVWRLLIKRQLLQPDEVRFETRLEHMDDLAFMVTTLLCCSKVSIDDAAHYHYCLRTGSMSTCYREGMMEVQFEVANYIKDRIKREGLSGEILRRVGLRYLNACLMVVKNEVADENLRRWKDRVQIVRQACLVPEVMRAVDELDTRGYTFRKRFVLKAVRNKSARSLLIYYYMLEFLKKLRQKF